jgi:endonuclease/exonuclease/phosphatase family metal-dependent hydrolase
VKYFNFIVAILLSLLYATVRIPPTEKYNLWITSFIIPVALVVNHILLFISLILRKKSSIYYMISLLVGIPYLFGTLGIKSFFKGEKSAATTFSVVNYNIGSFHMRPYAYKNIDSARIALKNWIINAESDIRCIQEFTNYPWSKEFNVIEQLNRNGMHYYFSQEEEPAHVNYSRTGILIISKFPIIGRGDLLASKNGFNRIAYADIKTHQDTIRIINVHLESMGLGQFDPRNANDLGSVKSTTRTILSKLKQGVFERSKQIKQLADFIHTSPYPVICVGDFNDMPYSYSYQFLKKTLNNTFEESGKGLGFTYRGGTLKVLRIDNQFYTSPIHSVGFETMYDLKLSDHYPLRGEYQIQK